MPENHPVLNNKRIVTGTSGKHIIVNGHNCLNLGTHNYLGLLNSPDILEEAIASVRKYGVGSCGPRGFYGTIGNHDGKRFDVQYFHKNSSLFRCAFGA